MINIPLSDLSKENFYARSLQVIEDLCEEYQLNNQFGIISMANQVVVDFLQSLESEPIIDVNFHIDNEDLTVLYQASDSIFSQLSQYDCENGNVMQELSDKIDYNSDYKSFMVTFHVKPKIKNTISQVYIQSMKEKLTSKFRYCITLLVFLVAVFTIQAQKYNVLFIGNSYTSVNDLPQLVQKVAASAGDTITYTMHAPGGCTFQQHVSGAASLYQQGGWDYVVLQEQSQLPSFPYSQFQNECYPYAQQLCQFIRQYNPDAKIVFYMTWGRKNGDQNNCQYYQPLCTYEGMDSLLYARYMEMAEDNEAYVSPVGRVWHRIRDNYPEIELYQADESHPSMAGSYAAACSFYTMFFQKSPLNITEDCNVDANVANIIRQVAATQVYDSLDKWMFVPGTISVDDYAASSINVYPNPARNTVQVQYAFTNESVVEVSNMQGQILNIAQPGEVDLYSMDISALEDGFYFVRISNPNRSTVVRKFVKVSL